MTLNLAFISNCDVTKVVQFVFKDLKICASYSRLAFGPIHSENDFQLTMMYCMVVVFISCISSRGNRISPVCLSAWLCGSYLALY